MTTDLKAAAKSAAEEAHSENPNVIDAARLTEIVLGKLEEDGHDIENDQVLTEAYNAAQVVLR